MDDAGSELEPCLVSVSHPLRGTTRQGVGYLEN
jgi:hypothetical protein